MAPSKMETGLSAYWAAPQWTTGSSTALADEYGSFRGTALLPEPTDAVFSGAFECQPRHQNSLIPIRSDTISKVPRSSELSTDMLAFLMSAKIADMHRALSTEISDLQSAVGAIAGTVEMLASHSFAGSAHSSTNVSDVREADEFDVRDVLNATADGGHPNYQVKTLAVDSLQSKTPSVRSAAARALAAIDPDLARELLPSLAAKEVSRVAKRVIEAALRAAVL